MSMNLQHAWPAFALVGGIVLGVAALTSWRRFNRRLREQTWFDVEELKRRTDVEADLLVLDVRTAADFVGEQGHLTFARNLPLEELNDRLGELGADPQRSIAIVCRTDRRSATAAALLAEKGFVNVHVVRGGMTAWLERGWPSSRETDEPRRVLSGSP